MQRKNQIAGYKHFRVEKAKKFSDPRIWNAEKGSAISDPLVQNAVKESEISDPLVQNAVKESEISDPAQVQNAGKGLKVSDKRDSCGGGLGTRLASQSLSYPPELSQSVNGARVFPASNFVSCPVRARLPRRYLLIRGWGLGARLLQTMTTGLGCPIYLYTGDDECLAVYHGATLHW